MLPSNDPTSASGPPNPEDQLQTGELPQMPSAPGIQVRMPLAPVGSTALPARSKRRRILSIALLALVVLSLLAAIGGGALLATAHVIIPPAYQNDQGVIHFVGTRDTFSSTQQSSSNLTVLGIEEEASGTFKFYFFHREAFPAAPGFNLEEHISLLYRPDETLDVTDFLASMNLRPADGVSAIAAKIVQVKVSSQVFNSSEYITAQGRPLAGYILLSSGLGVALVTAVAFFIARRRAWHTARTDINSSAVVLAQAPAATSPEPSPPPVFPPPPIGTPPVELLPVPTPFLGRMLSNQLPRDSLQPLPSSGPIAQAPAMSMEQQPVASGPIASIGQPLVAQLEPLPLVPPNSKSDARGSRWMAFFAFFALALLVLGGILFTVTPASSASVDADGLMMASSLAMLIAGLALIALPFMLRFRRGRSGRSRQKFDAPPASVGAVIGSAGSANYPLEAPPAPPTPPQAL